MTVDEAITIAETALNYDRLNKIQEIVFRQSWEGRSYGEIAKTTGYQYDYIKATGYELWKLLSQVFGEKVKRDNLKSVLKRYLRKSQVNLQRNLTIEVNLSGANLSGANLSGARLFANLNEADYVQTDLDKTINADSETELSNSENEINWNGFCLHSDAQMNIAEILDRTSTLFIPNSQLRLATPAERQNQQADFPIFHQNKLGILKIDSELSHPNTTEDEKCDRLFRDSDITVVKHYDATRCSEQPDIVVQEFLEILSQA
jgi:uncharacterized protein YjbI with pentapeptide repeats